MNGRKERKALEDKIRREAEKEPLPEALEPEAVEARLRLLLQQEQKEAEKEPDVGEGYEKEKKVYISDRKNRIRERKRIPRAAFYAAACMALILTLTAVAAVQNGNFFTKKTEQKGTEEVKGRTEQETKPEAEKTEEIKEVLTHAASEEELYEKLKNAQEERAVTGATGAVTNIMFDDAIAESAAGSTADAAIGDSVNGAYNANVPAETPKKESMSDRNVDADYSKTNVQEENVEEADIVKTDGKYLYIRRAKGNEIAIVRADGEKMQTVGRIAIPEDTEDLEQYLHEFYVDGDRLILLKSVYSYYASAKSRVRDSVAEATYTEIYDISDRSAPKQTAVVKQDGAYHSSRMHDGYLYVFSDHYVYGAMEQDKPETFMPCVDGEVMACADIYVPEQVDSGHYKVITGIDPNAAESVWTEKAVLCGSGMCYVSENAIYFLSENYTNQTESGQTEIWKISYLDGKMIGSARGTVKGSVNDQFAVSESNGYLRLVTTYYTMQAAAETPAKEETDNWKKLEENNADVEIAPDNMANGLYILDSNLKQTGCIEDLAPGERIYSARFFENTAYFVTFRRTDPLFSVDVSDPAAPKLLGELKLPGFSEYLHPYGEGRLLGIGYETDENGAQTGIKLSMFDISDPSNVKEIAHETVTGGEASYSSSAMSDHRAVLADVGRNLIGFHLEGYLSSSDGAHYRTTCNEAYVVYGYEEGRGFFLKNKTELTVSWRNDEDFTEQYEKCCEIRGVYIGNYFYTVHLGDTIRCFDMDADFVLKSEYAY